MVQLSVWVHKNN